MAETTKRTIRENITINQQLAKMSAKTMEVIAENEMLVAREKRDKQRVEILAQAEADLGRRNYNAHKIIRALLAKIKTLQSHQDDEEGKNQDGNEKDKKEKGLLGHTISEAMELSDDHIAELEERVTSLSEQVTELKEEAAVARQERDRELHQKEALLSRMDDLTRFLVVTADEAKEAVVIAAATGECGDDDEGESESSEWKANHVFPESLSDASPKERAAVLDFLVDKLHGFQHARQDFFLAPTQSESNTGEEVVKDLSGHKALPSVGGGAKRRVNHPKRAVPSTSVATQTSSAQKALFFSEQLMPVAGSKRGSSSAMGNNEVWAATAPAAPGANLVPSDLRPWGKPVENIPTSPKKTPARR